MTPEAPKRPMHRLNSRMNCQLGRIWCLIDGGQGQLTAARETLEELGLTDVPLVGIAKGPRPGRRPGEVFHHGSGKPSFMLPERDPVLYFVQRLREMKRTGLLSVPTGPAVKKDIAKNPLDEIAGVGPDPKEARCSAHFGTAKAVSKGRGR
jgi:excinuclease ABC subunit C